MRKYLYGACLVFGACSLASSQVQSYGVKVGASNATQVWEHGSGTSQATDYLWGVAVGAFIEWFDVPTFSVYSEIQYVQKGVTYNIALTNEQNPSGTGETFTVRPRLDYLSFPLLAKLRLDLSQSQVYLFVGPRFDFLLARDGDGWFNSPMDQFDSFDFGGTIGVGIQTRSIFDMATGVEFRYSPSFQEGYSNEFVAITNRSFEVLLTIGS